MAEGVRIYSQDTWKLLFGDNGRAVVERYIDDTVCSNLLYPDTCACLPVLLLPLRRIVSHCLTMLISFCSPSSHHGRLRSTWRRARRTTMPCARLRVPVLLSLAARSTRPASANTSLRSCRGSWRRSKTTAGPSATVRKGRVKTARARQRSGVTTCQMQMQGMAQQQPRGL